jgi:hypothetical protein
MQIKTKNVSCHTADSKPVKQEVNCTVILPPLVLPEKTNGRSLRFKVIFRISFSEQKSLKIKTR